MNLKRIVTVIVCLLVAGAAIIYLNYRTTKKTNPETEKALAEISAKRIAYTFTGDDGVLLKGKLLDDKYQSEYDKLPDTLAHILFKDELYCLNCRGDVPPELTAAGEPDTVAEKHYSLFSEAVYSNGSKASRTLPDKRFKQLGDYLKLAETGSATFPHFTLAKGQRNGDMMNAEVFHDKYSDRFNSSELVAIPYDLKEILLDFFNSAMGKDFDFVRSRSDKDHFELVSGNFTGNSKNELACFLQRPASAEGGKMGRIMVFVRNSSGQIREVYDRTYSDVQLTLVPAHTAVYQDAEGKKPLPNDAVLIKETGRPDIVLAYLKRYETMYEYQQIPTSKMPGA